MPSSIQQHFFIFTSFLLLHGFITDAASTIRSGDQLNSTAPPLLSPGGNFTLGFFKIDQTNYTYLGIWYTNDDQARKVWVANRDSPIISDDSVILSIDNSTGKLIIANKDRTFISIPDHQGWPGANLTAGIQDSGNFVLIDENENRVLWQSFDYPTNVLLPGMKLGYNLNDGKYWNLTSWLSYEIPAMGSFSLSWESNETNEPNEPNEPNGELKRLMVRLRGQPYWTSGNLKNQTFEFIYNLNAPSSEYSYNLSYVDNREEKYFSMEGINGNLPMWILRPDGKITDADNFAVWGTEDFCYGYETNDGCVDSSVLLAPCRGRNDRFSLTRTTNFIPTVTSRYIENSSLSLGDCMETCWKECDCVGFTTSGNGTSCVLWNGKNEFEVNEQGTSVEKYVLSPRKSGKSKKSWIWIVMSVCISVVVFLGLGIFGYLKRRKRKLERKDDEYFRELMASESLDNTSEPGIDGRKGHDLIFSYASVVAATDDFSNENKLGEGGFGPVYKGKLTDGREIAIKRLSRTSGQGLVEFKNELILIAKLQHTNLVRVLGCCIHRDEKMLIYEYMPNKSLDFFLFDQKKSSILDWQKRANIIEGIAQGLLYLHKYSRMRVIHRDLKASNVLLDEYMNPKIADFGMARIFKPNETEAMTNRVVGTYGYMSPEYAMEGTFSVKSDVFSFGVLVLEIVSGRRNNSFYHLDRPLNLVGYAWELWKEGDGMELKDPTLGHSFEPNQLLRTVHVGLLCVQESATDRPDMSDVISMLGNETSPLPYPKQPAFFTGRSAYETTSSEAKAKDYSVNEASITVMEPR